MYRCSINNRQSSGVQLLVIDLRRQCWIYVYLHEHAYSSSQSMPSELTTPCSAQTNTLVISIFFSHCGVVIRSVASVCLSVCRVGLPSSESLWKTSFSVCMYIVRIYRSKSHIKVIGSSPSSRSQKQNTPVCPVRKWSAFDWKAKGSDAIIVSALCVATS